MNNPCNCYYGEDCTKTTVCANESIVEDLEERILRLEEVIATHADPTGDDDETIALIMECVGNWQALQGVET